LGNAQPREVAELDQVGRLGIGGGQSHEGGVDVQHIVDAFGSGGGELVEVQANAIATPFLALLATSIIDQDAAHGLGRGGKEVAAAVPVLGFVRVHQPEVGLVDQGRGLERLAGYFLGQLLGGQLAQLVVDQRKE